jgi:hypothetical protein
MFTRRAVACDQVLPPWNPQHRATLLHNVCTAMRLGFFKEAQLMLDHEPHTRNDAACLNLLGVIYELRQQWKLARRCYRWSVQADSTYGPARQNIRRLYELETFGHSREGMALGDERPALATLLLARQPPARIIAAAGRAQRLPRRLRVK